MNQMATHIVCNIQFAKQFLVFVVNLRPLPAASSEKHWLSVKNHITFHNLILIEIAWPLPIEAEILGYHISLIISFSSHPFV